MDNLRLETVLRHVRKLVGPGAALADGELLDRFVRHDDEAAFELLVRRHAPLVWGVCRRTLGNAHDADDAFQATLLILVRKAASLDRRGSVAGWLYRVATRVATRARANQATRQQRVRSAGEFLETVADPVAADVDLRRILDEELDRLPEKYRVPVVLCYLQGKTHEEAADELHWPLGTLKCRVLRGRDRLRTCLARRGLALSGAVLAMLLARESASAAVPMGLVDMTVKAALASAAGNTAAGFAPEVVALAEGALHTMFLQKIKLVAAAAVILTVLGSGVGTWTYHARAEQSAGIVSAAGAGPVQAAAETPKPEVAAEKPAPEKATSPLDPLWTDLAGDDATALRAILTLAARPKETVPYFKDHLKPVLVDAKRIAALIRDLDDAKFLVREKASTELEAMGEYAVPYLEGALKSKPALEVANRIEKLLERLKSPTPPVEWVRAVRAIAILEQIGGPDARQILETVKTGRTKAWPTQEAEAALDRLTERPNTTIEGHWKDLASKNEAKVARALLALAATPKETVDFVKKAVEKEPKQRPASGEGKIRLLIGQLNSDKFAERVNASDELGKIGQAAVPLLQQTAQDQQANLELRRRAEILLKTIAKGGAGAGTGPVKDGAPEPRIFTRRVLMLLEGIGTAEAKQLVDTIEKNKLVLGQIESGRVAMSPDGKLRASGEADGSIRIWDVATGKEVRRFLGQQAPIVQVTWSPDGRTLTSVSSDQVTAIWDVTTGKLLAKERGGLPKK